jgi:hypothetical protein
MHGTRLITAHTLQSAALDLPVRLQDDNEAKIQLGQMFTSLLGLVFKLVTGLGLLELTGRNLTQEQFVDFCVISTLKLQTASIFCAKVRFGYTHLGHMEVEDNSANECSPGKEITCLDTPAGPAGLFRGEHDGHGVIEDQAEG